MISQEMATIASFVLFFVLCFLACVYLLVKYVRLNRKLEEAEAKLLLLAETSEEVLEFSPQQDLGKNHSLEENIEK